jgi:hypothetical protein
MCMSNRVGCLMAAAAIGGTITPSVAAQDFNNPTFYFWGDYPPNHFPSSTMIRKQIAFELSGPSTAYHLNIEALADDMTDQIAADDRKAEPDLDAALLDCVGSHRVTPAKGR